MKGMGHYNCPNLGHMLTVAETPSHLPTISGLPFLNSKSSWVLAGHKGTQNKDYISQPPLQMNAAVILESG